MAVGLALSSWPPISIWLRPLALVAIGAAASVLGVLVWSDPERRDRWLDGLGAGVVIVSVTAAAVFLLQHFASVIDVRDGVVSLMGFFAGSSPLQSSRTKTTGSSSATNRRCARSRRLSPPRTTSGGYLAVTLPLVVARWFLAPPGPWRSLAGTRYVR